MCGFCAVDVVILTKTKTMDISLRVELNRLRRDFADISGSRFNQAVVAAINRASTMTKTKTIRTVRAKYKIKRKDLAATMTIKRAHKGQGAATAQIVTIGRPIPLMAFSPRKVSAGVSVSVSGTRKTIKSAFFATMPNGHKGVFARGQYGKKGFEFRTKRMANGEEFRLIGGRWVPIDAPDLPITELMSLSTAAAFKIRVEETQAETGQFIQDVFVKRLSHELTRARGGTSTGTQDPAYV